MNASARRRFEQRLLELRSAFLFRLPRLGSELDRLETELRHRGDAGLLDEIRQAVHSLAGTASTFKVEPVGSEAHSLARFLGALDEASVSTGDTRDRLRTWIRRVAALAHQASVNPPGRDPGARREQ